MNWNPEKEVPSFELCKELKELGYPQDNGGWYWEVYRSGRKLLVYSEFFGISKYHPGTHPAEIVKAPTVRELGEYLPSDYRLDFLKFTNEEFQITFIAKHICRDTTEANVRAKMLIWLAENKYVEFR